MITGIEIRIAFYYRFSLMFLFILVLLDIRAVGYPKTNRDRLYKGLLTKGNTKFL